MRSLLLSVLCIGMAFNLFARHPELQGNVDIHDPSTIIQSGDRYWVFGTGKGIISLTSKDLVNWEAGPRVFTNAPSWTTNAVPGFRGTFWAPDVIRVKDRYLLYYSVSTLRSQTSAIGLATNATLDPLSPKYRWHDCGLVMQSSPQLNYNTIDPSVMLDRDDKLWMVVGSFWSGIKLVELDPDTGKRMSTNTPIAVAWKQAIEAGFLHRHEDWYYLFVNWDACCRGTNSTYNIRVGRSRTVEGPYVDRDGVAMLKGGGTLLLAREGRFIGPGHPSIVHHKEKDFLSFHYYDGNRQGKASLGLRELGWDKDGWPTMPK